jgi:hypothetical protein
MIIAWGWRLCKPPKRLPDRGMPAARPRPMRGGPDQALGIRASRVGTWLDWSGNLDLFQE